MKILPTLLLLFFFFHVRAQNPVQVNQPQWFRKYIIMSGLKPASTSDSIIGILNDTLTLVPNTSGSGDTAVVKNVSTVNGFGIISSVINPSTLPSIHISVDSAALSNKYYRIADTVGKWIGIQWLSVLAAKQNAMGGAGYSKFNGNSIGYVSQIPNNDIQNPGVTFNHAFVYLGDSANIPALTPHHLIFSDAGNGVAPGTLWNGDSDEIISYNTLGTGSGGGGGNDSINVPNAVTTIPTLGQDYSQYKTVSTLLIGMFYGLKPPTATLTGGTTLEYTNASTESETLNWSAGRQSNTATLATIVVASVNQSFSQPGPNSSVSGNQSVNVPTNTTTTYNNVVTASDGQTATANTTFQFQQKIYAGFVSTATPNSSQIIAATGSSYVGGKFATSRNQSGSLSTPSGASYIMFANPVSMGVPNVTINGLGVDFNVTTISFTNASGYVSNYYVAVSPTTTSGSVASYVIN